MLKGRNVGSMLCLVTASFLSSHEAPAHLANAGAKA